MYGIIYFVIHKISYPYYNNPMQKTDITIIGAGVIGLAIAYELSNLGKEVVVLEKNASFGEETSSRNSEVIHAGLYYRPHSLKAETCIRGGRLLYELCAKHNITHKKLGKLVVAPTGDETAEIEGLYRNALSCGVENLSLFDRDAVKKMSVDIDVKTALYSPDSGIIDSHRLMRFFFESAQDKGAIFAFLNEVVDIKKTQDNYRIRVKETGGGLFDFQSQAVINSAGLSSDKIAALVGLDTGKLFYRIFYCKGQYFRVRNPQKFSIRRLIYPPATKTDLGIHITPDLAGGLRLGPDAKYVDKIDYDVDEKDKTNFHSSVRRFLPRLEMEDLVLDTAGIRPKLQGPNDDFRDFIIRDEAENGFPAFINLIGIESPGLTACLSIAEKVKKIAVRHLAG